MKQIGIFLRLKESLDSSLHTRGLVLWAAALATGILVVSQHVYSVRLATEIADLRDTSERIEAEIGFLEMECMELSSRRRVEEYAVERLEMRYPRQGEVISLRADDRNDRIHPLRDYVFGGNRGSADG